MTKQNYDSEKQYYIYQIEIRVLEYCIYSSTLKKYLYNSRIFTRLTF